MSVCDRAIANVGIELTSDQCLANVGIKNQQLNYGQNLLLGICHINVGPMLKQCLAGLCWAKVGSLDKITLDQRWKIILAQCMCQHWPNVVMLSQGVPYCGSYIGTFVVCIELNLPCPTLLECILSLKNVPSSLNHTKYGVLLFYLKCHKKWTKMTSSETLEYMWCNQAKWVLCRALSNFRFVVYLVKQSESFVLLNTLSKSELRFQRYSQFCAAENNKIQKELHTTECISKSTFTTYDSFR